MKVITAIALLCQVSASAGPERIARDHLACQKYYIACYEGKSEKKWIITSESTLAQCIKERVVN